MNYLDYVSNSITEQYRIQQKKIRKPKEEFILQNTVHG